MAPSRQRNASTELTEEQTKDALEKFQATLRLHGDSASELDRPMFQELVREMLLDGGTV